MKDNSSSGQMSRRGFLGAGLVLAGGTLAGCGGSTAAVERAATKWFSDTTVLADGTPQRMVWSLTDDLGNLGDAAPDSIDVEIIGPDGSSTTTTADVHRDGVALPYYPVMGTFPLTGAYELRISSSAGGYVGFVTPTDPSADRLIQPGQQMPAIVTPTATNPAGVDPICTRSPACEFHEISLDEALASGTPTILIVSTPAFCGTQWMCGPVLEHVIEADPAAQVIHAEVYAAPTAQELGDVAPIITATGAIYEPFIYAIDGSGTAVRRLDHIWDTTELAALIATIS